jgi:hypothetical protein
MEPSNRQSRALTLAILKGAWIYLLILWAYIVIDMFLFPEYQYLGISRYIPIPENLLADIAFPISLVCFIGWEYMRKL